MGRYTAVGERIGSWRRGKSHEDHGRRAAAVRRRLSAVDVRQDHDRRGPRRLRRLHRLGQRDPRRRLRARPRAADRRPGPGERRADLVAALQQDDPQHRRHRPQGDGRASTRRSGTSRASASAPRSTTSSAGRCATASDSTGRTAARCATATPTCSACRRSGRTTTWRGSPTRSASGASGGQDEHLRAGRPRGRAVGRQRRDLGRAAPRRPGRRRHVPRARRAGPWHRDRRRLQLQHGRGDQARPGARALRHDVARDRDARPAGASGDPPGNEDAHLHGREPLPDARLQAVSGGPRRRRHHARLRLERHHDGTEDRRPRRRLRRADRAAQLPQPADDARQRARLARPSATS